MRKNKTFWVRCGAVFGAFALLLPEVAVACEQCFGAGVDTDTTRGIQLAMLALLGMTGLVGSGIVLFFVNMGKRVRLLEPGTFVVGADGELRPSADERDEPDAP